MKKLTKKQHEALGHALYCTDPRHETPCPQPCVGCDCDGCDKKYLKWFDMDNKLVTGKQSKQKKVFACCRWTKRNQPVFYAVCSTMDRAQRQVDKLTMRFGPTFLIIDAPLDP